MVQDQISSSSYLSQMNPTVGSLYSAMRAQISADCGLDPLTQDLIVITAYAVRRMDLPFQNHCAAMLARGVAPETIRVALLLTLGASLPVGDVVHASRLLDALLTAGT